jgi:diguanylate cyclase (GGDEF)-like protein
MPDDMISPVSSAGVKGSPLAGLSTITQSIAAWGGAAADWVRSGPDVTGLGGRGNDALHDMAKFLKQARDPAEIQDALVQLVYRLSGATRVELHRSEGHGRVARRVACWPEPAGGPSGNFPDSAEAPLCLPLSLGGRTWGTLHLVADRRRWPPRLLRQLTVLGTWSAAAERSIRASWGAGTATPLDPITGLFNEPFLSALLAFALNQARRRREPLAILYIEIDLPGSVAERLTPEIADALLQRVAPAIVRTLRTSDIVARLDDDRIAAILPAAPADDAACVAEAVRRAIAEAGQISATMRPLTASIGVAGYPDHAQPPQELRDAAAEAVALARFQGGDRIVMAGRASDLPPLRLVSSAV